MSRVMEENKENNDRSSKLPPAVIHKLIQNENQLTNYLKYIRHKPTPQKIPLSLPKHLTAQPKENNKEKKVCNLVKTYVEEYLKLVKDVNNLECYAGRKIIMRLMQYLQEFPSMSFLVETINAFGKEKKKLCLNQSAILNQVNDQMVPLFQKVIERVQFLKKESESKKLMELGQRISHLHKVVDTMRKHVISKDSPIRQLQQERVEKYLIMEENISRAEKNYGKFSQNFHKNQEVFSNINKVYQQISKTQQHTKN